MPLGSLELPQSQWKALAACLERKLSGQETLLPDDPAIEAVALRAIDQYKVVEQKREDKEIRQEQQQLMTVDVSTLATSHHRSLGPELVAQKA
ncbi:MAG: transposase IS4 family protein, partial [Bacillota bacterium]